MSACKRLFLLLLQHRKIVESENSSTNLRLNESQKVFLLLLAPYSLKIVAILLVNARKPLKLYCFLSEQNLVALLI